MRSGLKVITRMKDEILPCDIEMPQVVGGEEASRLAWHGFRR
jgi:hypothetical protein